VGCGLDSTGSGQGPVASCCECGDEPAGSCATELVSYCFRCEGRIKRYLGAVAEPNEPNDVG
jgi:hypothetical protein